jgi:hypothetical protein
VTHTPNTSDAVLLEPLDRLVGAGKIVIEPHQAVMAHAD